MDEIELKVCLYYEGNVSAEDMQDLQDRFSEFMERQADKLLGLPDAELTDYEIELTRI
jgi:hypothetical protein